MTQTNKAIEERGFQRLKEDIPFRYLGVTRCILHDTLAEQQKYYEHQQVCLLQREQKQHKKELKESYLRSQEAINHLKEEIQQLKAKIKEMMENE